MSKSPKKQAQAQENQRVIEWYNAVGRSIYADVPTEQIRLRTCNAHVDVYKGIDIVDENGVVLLENETVYVLVSYVTRVAFVIESMNFGCDFLRFQYGYTATSAQHIAKFFHDYLNPFHLSHTIRYY